MSDKELSFLLEESLNWIDETGESIQAAASRHPNHYKELIELLQTFEVLGSYERPTPRPEFKAAARTRLMNQINALEKTKSQKSVTKTQPIRLIWQNIFGNRRFAMTWLIVIGMIVSFVGGGGGTVYASSSALPGDALYPVKTGIQDIRLFFSNDAKDVDLLLEHMQENLREMQQLVIQGRYGDFQFGLDEYKENLQALTQTRARIAEGDNGSGTSLNNRIQQQLILQSNLLEQLKEQSRDRIKLQEKLQEAIQLTEEGYTYGPQDGGQYEEPGSPDNTGHGESQIQNGKPEDSGSGNNQGSGSNADPGSGKDEDSGSGNSPGPGGSGDTNSNSSQGGKN